MKLSVLTLALSLSVAAPAFADMGLAQSKFCMACHKVDKKVVGPAFQDVARKYQGQPDAAQRLAHKIVHGGKGVWGQVAMPANPKVSEAEALQLAQWVLSTK